MQESNVPWAAFGQGAMFDRGEGPPVVVIPGLQGRWEWAQPTLDRMARRCRTISYSLCGDIGSERRLIPELGFDNYVRQLDDVLDAAGVQRAALCGVSFGGVVALRYAAIRPDRVSGLVLVSTPGPGWQPSAQQSKWIARPWWSTPAFVLGAPLRVWPEVSAAFPDRAARIRFIARQGLRCVAHPMIPSLMASRVHTLSEVDVEKDCRAVRTATLVISGEEPLDRMVPVRSTRTYATAIPRARYTRLERTGHMGLLTRPEQFAEIVSEFVHAHHQ